MKPHMRVSPQSLTFLPRPGRNPAYVKFVRSQPCCVSGRNWGVEFAHTGPRGLSQTANDLDGIPLNREFHLARYKNSYHSLGRVKFEIFHGISVERTIQYLQALAVSSGISLETVKRKGFGRARQSKRGTVEGAA